jgi:hypothetical protein
MADLSGFPVIRIDQIPLVDSKTLKEAYVDVKDLIKNLIAESEAVPPFVHYLRKQNDAITAELLNRAAQDRINKLLGIASESLEDHSLPNDGYDDDGQSVVSALTEKSATVRDLSGTNSMKEGELKSDVPKTFQPLPLPSEIKSKRTLLTTSQTQSSPSLTVSTTAQDENLIGHVPSRVKADGDAGLKGFAGITGSSGGCGSSGIALASSRSTDERHSGSSGFFDGLSASQLANSEKVGEARASRTQQQQYQRPVSVDDQPSRISRRSLAIINDNFGSKFIVAGEGRRRRPLPAKKPVESLEDLKAREQLER